MYDTQVVPDGYTVKISWRQPELINKQYSEKLKSADNLHDLLPSDGKIIYAVKMTSKDKTVDNIYRYLKCICVFLIYLFIVSIVEWTLVV